MTDRTTSPPHTAAQLTDRVLAAAGTVILGKNHALRLALACLLARGHLLIEDLPGTGKTTLAHLLARLLGLEFARIQFTSDLLPADIIGVSIFERAGERFRFHPGPIFSQLILADEINRATPRTQSALLEAMEEHQVTVEGETRALPEPFFVIATQNPLFQVGTFALPESQLDRFLMCIRLGYPAATEEKALLAGADRRTLVAHQPALLDNRQLLDLQAQVERVHAAAPIVDYVHAILQFSRTSERFGWGLSPRAGLAILRAARAWALLDGRDYLIPEDVQAILPACAGHRLTANDGSQPSDGSEAAEFILGHVPL